MHKQKSTMKRYLFLMLLAVAIAVAAALVGIMLQSPEEKDRQVIKLCWKESRDTTIPLAQQRVTDGTCRALEELYWLNYGLGLSHRETDA